QQRPFAAAADQRNEIAADTADRTFGVRNRRLVDQAVRPWTQPSSMNSDDPPPRRRRDGGKQRRKSLLRVVHPELRMQAQPRELRQRIELDRAGLRQIPPAGITRLQQSSLAP